MALGTERWHGIETRDGPAAQMTYPTAQKPVDHP